MYCKQCGMELNNNATFCPKCGTRMFPFEQGGEMKQQVHEDSATKVEKLKVQLQNEETSFPSKLQAEERRIEALEKELETITKKYLEVKEENDRLKEERTKATRVCPNCGEKIEGNFCMMCGTKL